MSYETVLTLFIVFSIPAFILVVARLILMKRQEKSEQAQLDEIFGSHEGDSGKMSF